MIDYHVTVTPEEADRLSHDLTTAPLDALLEMFNYCSKSWDGNEKQWTFMCTLAAVWNAGRVQGIREERARRRARGSQENQGEGASL